ncbi:O-antigen ligase family protein [Streptococcus suis]|uniref:O-antigen ligase family protein n=1 Tax=Streptococcus suis TaxID=1307 RepID=A0A4V4RWJ2_STRSU|nr:O-antigen ligase family protein [Streptococcus suis]MBM7268950.1 O-antigen ligase family protein [Streptococcus suis]MBM7269336.1 O-antigen ligase family protein [Streptococcus suis]MBM7314088.1 O-antigen ligase family protein [Streptococcus suis]TII00115.1 O-antigen ligase family protein [Streptococcus suis]
MRKITDTMFMIILLNLIPTALLGLFDLNLTIYTGLYFICFVLQCILMWFSLGDNASKLSRPSFQLFVMIVLLQLFSHIYLMFVIGNYILSELMVMISVTVNLYFFIFQLHRVHLAEKDIICFFKRLCQLAFAACLLNVFLNFNQLRAIGALTGSYGAQFKSFFPNRNTFGIFLLVAIISNQYLIDTDKRKIHYFLQLFFILNLILTFARTSIAGMLIFYFSYVVSKIVVQKQVNLKVIAGLLVLFATSVFFLDQMMSSTNILEKIDTLLLRTDSLEDGSGRFDVWLNGLEIGLSTNPLLGVGRYKALEMNKEIFGNDLNYFHSLYVETFVTYGIFGLMILIGGCAYIFKSVFCSSFTKKYITLASLFTFGSISLLESTTRFSIGYADTISLIFFFSLPILISQVEVEQISIV